MGCVVLVVLVAAVFGRSLGFGFIPWYDDEDYVTENLVVRGGITPAGAAWAFTSMAQYANWHPLTWLSHQLDVQLFGLVPWGHHLTNLLFHAANAVLVFLVLARLSGAPAPAFLVAALFAVHPLHVESVAQVATRKDLLSAFFWLLAILAWARRVERPTRGIYAVVCALFALGIMAKPIIITLPITLMLLDWWPLGRLRQGTFVTIFREKIPLFALAAVSAGLTVLAQARGEAIVGLQRIPLTYRLNNAAESYLLYLGRTVWPSGLSFFYPYPVRGFSPLAIGGSFLLLAMITAAVLRLRTRPYLLMGWLWYLVTLVPVIGIVQVGSQAMADRYTYIPLLGPFLAVAWWTRDACRSATSKRAWALGWAAVLIALAARARIETGFWRDGETLFRRAMAVTRDNWFAANNLALVLLKQGDFTGARFYLQESLQANPENLYAYNNMGLLAQEEGETETAAGWYRRALIIEPRSPQAANNLGVVLVRQGRFAEARDILVEVVRKNPDYVEARNNLGVILMRQGRFTEAGDTFVEALRRNPEYADAHHNMGLVLEATGHDDEALFHYREAIRLEPGHKARASLERLLATRANR